MQIPLTGLEFSNSSDRALKLPDLEQELTLTLVRTHIWVVRGDVCPLPQGVVYSRICGGGALLMEIPFRLHALVCVRGSLIYFGSSIRSDLIAY